ncbi:MAG: TetR/AcrR family transcriptional regulator [Lactobacillales bacterium]|nr:TetR/AcrR family transcriptional regulator [Lactobacillales bacterium]
MATQTRKRGDELLNAIYDATLRVLNSEGMAAVTFSRIAVEAGSNRPSLYRRWDTPFDMVFDAARSKTMAIQGGLASSESLDTGSLRGDFIKIFTHLKNSSEIMGKQFALAMILEIGQGNYKITKMFDGTRELNVDLIDRILDQARNRGEEINEVSDDVKVLPFETIRYQTIVMHKPLTDEWIENLVDQVLIPVYTK